jgi:hypothetical protein
MRIAASIVTSISIAGLAHSFPVLAQVQQASSSVSSTAAATPTKSADQSASSSKPELTAEDKRLISEGYKLQMHRGEKLFCKSEHIVGSRFDKNICKSAEQIAAARQASQDGVNAAQRVYVGPGAH